VNDHVHSYSDLFDWSPVPAVVSRLADHTVLAVNARTSEIIGVPQADAVGLKVTDYYVDPADRLTLAERLRQDGRADNLRLRIRRQSGEPIWVLASSRLVTWHGEQAVLTIFQDIGDQVAAEMSLQASERRLVAQSDALTSLTARYAGPAERFDERLRSILEISGQALQVARLSMWRFEEAAAVIRCEGLYRPDAPYGSGLTLRRDDAPAYFAAIERERVVAAADACTDPRTREFRDAYLAPQGIGAMLDVPLRHDNVPVGVLCAEHVGGPRSWTVDEQNFAVSVANLIAVAIAEDERRRALARLAESEARARLIVDTAHDAFIGMDSSGAIVSWNARAEDVFGWSSDEAIGRNLAGTIVPPAFRDAHNNGMRRFHDTGEAPVVNQRLELTALHRSGREFPVELTITSPIPVAGGFFFGAFLRDISERRARDAELGRARDAAEAATRAKSEFLANMSHELRTPLNGVIGYAQILGRDRTLSAAQQEAVEAISRCGSQLLDLIDDVLDLAKIEAGRIEIVDAPTDLARLATDLQYVVAGSAARKGLRLAFTIDPEVPRSVVLDGRRLRQVLLNLLGNAVKFTSAGDVWLTVMCQDDRHLRFEVGDTGPGIEPEAQTAIFDAFVQTRTGAAAGGTGLGLAICDQLIRRMGGELLVESSPGEGSRFWFRMPLLPDTRRSDDAPDWVDALPFDAQLAPGERVTALVVDDSAANRRILAGLLESAGVEVITAEGGLEAIALAGEHRPRVVFMDLRMDGVDGLEAARRLARDPETAAIPVIAVTASAFGDVERTAREAGCVDCLWKPIRAPLLFGLLRKHLGVRFVSAQDRVESAGAGTMAPHRATDVATRLQQALALGDIGEIQALARQLMQGDDAETAVGEHINRLAAGFDFQALRDLADTLIVGS
jgi:PAS domain S-box-containing protein